MWSSIRGFGMRARSARRRAAEPARRASAGLRRHRRHRSLEIVIPAGTLLTIVLACFVGPLVLPLPPPVGGRVLDAGMPLLTEGHLLGTDENGNDTLARLLHGGQASLAIAVAVNAVGLVLGGSIGAVAGYAGGWLDSIAMRSLDVLMAVPSLVLALVVAQIVGPGPGGTVLALSAFSVPAYARLARAETLRLRDRPFMTAAALCGAGGLRILARHVCPNVLPQLIAFALLGLGIAIVIEGGLGFLGLGVRPPEPSWGNMLYHGQQTLATRPELVLLPGGVLFVSVCSCNLLGEALRARWSR
jgi:peptide/nickel transport system permease protein